MLEYLTPKEHDRLLERFKSKFKKGAPDDCWDWEATVDNRGYGRIYVCVGEEMSAHRLSYILHVGEIPGGKAIYRTCKNRRCVNPKHMVVGVIQKHKVVKRPYYRLTKDHYKEVLRLRAIGHTYDQIQNRTNLGHNSINKIINRK